MLGYSRSMHKIAPSLLLLSSLAIGATAAHAQSPTPRPAPLLQPAPVRIAPPDPALRAAFEAAAGSGLDDLALAGFSSQPLAGWLEYAALRGRMDTLPLARGSTFLASSYLMALGLPLLFFLLISGGDAGVFFAHLANISDRFLGAEQGRQIGFLDEFKFVLIGVATLVVVWRLPRFINDLERELSGEKL